jgi:hypothetical protein
VGVLATQQEIHEGIQNDACVTFLVPARPFHLRALVAFHAEELMTLGVGVFERLS